MTGYRPEIDLIRSIAILSVFIFHLYPKILPNGYLGVDVFFVISGFLITNSIIREKKFSLSSFYEKRIKRILPSTYLLILATSIVSIFFYLPNDLSQLARTGNAALTFIANYNLKSKNYFDTMSEENPFLHMWSLSIEEQFYFFWPLLLILILKIKEQKNRAIVLCFLFGYSFITSLISSSPEKNFFLIQYRAYELLIGCVTSLVMSRTTRQVEIPYRQFLGPIIIVLFSSFFVVDHEYGTASKTLLLLLTSLSLVLMREMDVRSSIYKAFIGIGKNSFQIYLWHWPVIAIYRYLYPGTNIPLLWALLYFLVVVVLSNFVRKNFEVKIYKSEFRSGFSAISLMVIPGVLLAIFNLQLPAIQNHLSVIQEKKALVEIQTFLPDDNCHGKNNSKCSKFEWNNSRKVLLVGDSNAGHYYGYFQSMSRSNEFDLKLWSADACPPILLEFDEVGRSEICREKQKGLRDKISDINTVVLAGNWPLYFSRMKNFEDALVSTIRFFEEKNIKVYVMARIPILNSSQYYNYVRNKYLGFSSYSKIIETVENAGQVENSKIMKSLGDTNAVYLNPFPRDFNSPFIDGKLIYKDPEHLNYVGSCALFKKFPLNL